MLYYLHCNRKENRIFKQQKHTWFYDCQHKQLRVWYLQRLHPQNERI